MCQVEQGAIGGGYQAVVVALRYRDRNEALGQVSEVDPGGFHGGGPWRRLLLFPGGFLAGGLGLLTRGRVLVAALRRQRRVAIGRQYRRINGFAQWPLLGAHVQEGATGAGVDGGGEIQQLTAAEGGVVGLNERVGQVRVLPAGEVIEADVSQVVLTDRGVGEPLAIGREAGLESQAALAGVDQGYGIGLELDTVEMQMVVLEHHALPVR